MIQVPLSDAWADPDGYNQLYHEYMDKRERHIKALFYNDPQKALHYIRSGMKEEIEMYGIGRGGKEPLEDV